MRAADPRAAVACTGRGKIFHVACDKETRGFENGESILEANKTLAAAADRRLLLAANALTNIAARRALRLALNASNPWNGHGRKIRTRDQDKTGVAVRLLAHYASTRRRFFLAVGLASTHVHGHRICIPEAYELQGGHAIGPRTLLPARRSTDLAPPLVTWPNWDVPRFDVGERWQREVTGLYYACATHIDVQVGAMLGALDALGLAGTTSVIVQGDHGFSLGRHDRWSKYNLYEDATRVPLLFAVPGRGAAVVDAVVESLDVMPTILDLWGVRRGKQLAAGGPTDAAAHPDGAVRLMGAAGATATSAGLQPHRPPPDPVYYMLGGRRVPLDGESLMPFLIAAPLHAAPSVGAASGYAGMGGSSSAIARAAALRRRPYARCELREWMVLHRPSDKLLPGALPRRLVGHGWQLAVRVARCTRAERRTPLLNPAVPWPWPRYAPRAIHTSRTYGRFVRAGLRTSSRGRAARAIG